MPIIVMVTKNWAFENDRPFGCDQPDGGSRSARARRSRAIQARPGNVRRFRGERLVEQAGWHWSTRPFNRKTP